MVSVADFTTTRQPGEMANSYRLTAKFINSLEDCAKWLNFAIFNKTSQRISAKIGNLNHSREFTINKQWCLDNIIYASP